MNFFEHQSKARSQSRWIMLAFAAVTAIIVVAVDAVVVTMLALHQANEYAEPLALI